MKNTFLIAAVFLGLMVYLRQGSGEPFVSDADLVATGQIATISTGEEVEIADHLDPDGTTVIEFGAEW